MYFMCKEKKSCAFLRFGVNRISIEPKLDHVLWTSEHKYTAIVITRAQSAISLAEIRYFEVHFIDLYISNE